MESLHLGNDCSKNDNCSQTEKKSNFQNCSKIKLVESCIKTFSNLRKAIDEISDLLRVSVCAFHVDTSNEVQTHTHMLSKVWPLKTSQFGSPTGNLGPRIHTVCLHFRSQGGAAWLVESFPSPITSACTNRQHQVCSNKGRVQRRRKEAKTLARNRHESGSPLTGPEKEKF